MQVGKNKQGFTIVELLIVIVVIGILAAITIVSFNGVTGRANDTAVQSDLETMGKKLQLYYVDKGAFPQNTSDLVAASLVASKGAYMTTPAVAVNLGYCTNSGQTGYALFAMSKSGNRYMITNTSSVTTDTTGTVWNSGTVTLGGQCGAVSMNAPFTHGYVSSDTTTGPWRAWTGNN